MGDAIGVAPSTRDRWASRRASTRTRLPGGDLIVDAKYKRHISSANLHQMIAYCVLTGATRAAFVVPAGAVVDRRGYVFAPAASGAPIRVDVVELATHGVDVASWRAHGQAMAAALAPL